MIEETRLAAMRKPILCLDFDGVLHSYSSGWKGAANIPDLPVPGALEFLVKAMDYFDVHVFSSRSHQWGGRRAMKRWLLKHLIELGTEEYYDIPGWWREKISETAFADPWKYELAWAAKLIVKKITFSRHKPPAHVSIDDRGFQFNGEFPDYGELLAFKPWNKKPGAIQ